MKCVFPEISWHNRDPVLSLDIHQENIDFYRLATGGADCHVLIWQLKVLNDGTIDVEVIADLTRHQKTVNVVRWSPCGLYLASGDDDANVIIWNRKTDNIPLLESTSDNNKEAWSVLKVLRGHKEDVYDICWSPSSLKLLTGSIDNTAILWDFMKGKLDCILTEHKGFVQGVTWDPKDEYIATISSDRVCRVFPCTGKQVKARICKGCLPVPESHSLYKKEVKFFHDDTFKSYFRRLHFSPDGSLLAVPSGCVETDECKKALNAVYLFTLDLLQEPTAVYPSGSQSTLAVKFCPLLFELRLDGPEPTINLPYRMIFAVATDSDIILYDTQQSSPFAYIQKIHYTRLTDISWSSDGLLLGVSSTDGFCTFVSFEEEELGVVYKKEESEQDESILNMSGCEELPKEDVEVKVKEVAEVKPKKPNLLEQWAIRTPKKFKTDSGGKKDSDGGEKGDKEAPKTEEVEIFSSPKEVKRIAPKRIAPSKDGPKCSTPISPVVRKKPRLPDTPSSSPLLSFLKKKASPNKSCVSTIVADEEAMDAFPTQTENQKKESGEVIEVDSSEDSIDDFKLQYSHLTLLEAKENSVEEKPASENVEIETELVTKDKENLEGTAPETKMTADCDGGSNVGETEKTIEKPIAAGPSLQIFKKRVPLITLSSPKSKKA